MVVERLFEKYWKKNVPTFSLILGVVYTIVAYVTSFLLFKPFIGLATILFTVILALPAVIKLFDSQYEQEKNEGTNFVEKHRTIINFYVYFFIGCFLVFFLIALVKPSHVFSLEDLTGKSVTGKATDSHSFQLPTAKQNSLILSVFRNNVYVMVIAFLLSLFYGSGSLFLITFNGSIFAAALVQAIRLKIPHLGFLFTFSFIGCNLGIMFLHLIPEVGAYFLAAIAGGVLSNAVLKENWESDNFTRAMKNVLFLVGIAILVLLIAAIIEMNLSRTLFLNNTCSESLNPINIFYLVVVIAIFVAEFVRRKKKPSSLSVIEEEENEDKNLQSQIHNQVKDYVTHCRDMGFSDKDIKAKLLSAGVPKKAIKDALK